MRDHSIIKCAVVKTTAQAVYVLFDDLTCRWIPRSVIRDGDNTKMQDTNLWIADWFVEKEEL